MKLTWQNNKEWFGWNCTARFEDYKVTIQEMDGNCYCRVIEKDQYTLVRFTTKLPLDKAQQLLHRKLRRIVNGERFKNLFRSKRDAVAAA